MQAGYNLRKDELGVMIEDFDSAIAAVGAVTHVLVQDSTRECVKRASGCCPDGVVGGQGRQCCKLE